MPLHLSISWGGTRDPSPPLRALGHPTAWPCITVITGTSGGVPRFAGGCSFGGWLALGRPYKGTQGQWLLQVITPFRKLILCAENRKEMEDWISALKSVQKWEVHEVMWAGGCAGAPL